MCGAPELPSTPQARAEDQSLQTAELSERDRAGQLRTKLTALLRPPPERFLLSCPQHTQYVRCWPPNGPQDCGLTKHQGNSTVQQQRYPELAKRKRKKIKDNTFLL